MHTLVLNHPDIIQGAVDLQVKDYVEMLKGLSFESNKDVDIKRTPPREFEDPDQNGTPHVPGHFPL